MENPLIANKILSYLSIDERRNCRLICKVWNTEALKFLSNSVNHIFKYLDVKDLKNCRLVCKKWNTFAEVELQKKVRINLPSNQEVVRFTEEITRYENICSTVVLGKNVQIWDDEVQEFLNEVGPTIKEIDLHRAKWNISSLQKLLHEQLQNRISLKLVSGILPPNPDGDRIILHDESSDGNPPTPKSTTLKKLIFDMNILDSKHKIRNGFAEFLTDLFTICPQLKYFWCKSTSVYVRTYIHDLIVNSSDLLPNLVSLSTIIDFDENRLQRLESRNFPLTKVYLRIGIVKITVLHSLLSSLKSTLKQLGLHFNGPTARRSESAKLFPSSKDLQNLELLDLIGFRGKLHFIADFPNLKTLILKEVDIHYQFPYAADKIPCPNLKEIIFVEVVDSNAYRILVSSFFPLKRIKCLHYRSMDEFYHDNSPKKTWAENKRDIYHFPFS